MEREIKRLKSTIRISEILRNGKKLRGRCLALYYKPSQTKEFAVLIKKKSGNAVERNKRKRWVREAVRKNIQHIPFQCSVIYLLNDLCPKQNFSIINEDIAALLQKITV